MTLPEAEVVIDSIRELIRSRHENGVLKSQHDLIAGVSLILGLFKNLFDEKSQKLLDDTEKKWMIALMMPVFQDSMDDLPVPEVPIRHLIDRDDIPALIKRIDELSAGGRVVGGLKELMKKLDEIHHSLRERHEGDDKTGEKLRQVTDLLRQIESIWKLCHKLRHASSFFLVHEGEHEISIVLQEGIIDIKKAVREFASGRESIEPVFGQITNFQERLEGVVQDGIRPVVRALEKNIR